MMKLRILGETGPYPQPGGATTGLLLSTPEGHVMIDVGSGVMSELTRHVSLNELDGVIITHHHADHVTDVPVLRYGIMIERMKGKRQDPLTLYANKLPEKDFADLPFQEDVKAVPLDSSSEITLAGMKFTFANTVHAIPCLAVAAEYQGKRFVFSGDSGPSEELEKFAAGADFFLCEASWLDHEKGPASIGHLSPKEVGEMSKRGGVKNVCLTHFYPGADRAAFQAEAEAAYGGNVLMAEQGTVFEI